MENIVLDRTKIKGVIKPMHAINNAPIMGQNFKLFPYLKKAGIPYARLHDTGGAYGGNIYVDIGNVFRDFDNDPGDPDSYDFTFTDKLLEEITKQGTEIYYRLGTTIENYAYMKAYRIFPPKDNLKWAKICEGIIKHYNEGWANGYHFGIKYWEIWNEPDNEPEIDKNPMWRGTMEEYFKLYEVASNYLKEKFPDIKIGGYASSGFYELSGDGNIAKNFPHRSKHFMKFFNGFFDYITDKDHKAPLDFFSWHNYADAREAVKIQKFLRSKLDEMGFTNTELHLNEWNVDIDNRSKAVDCALIAEMMCLMQNTSLDILAFYDGQVNGRYCAIFDPVAIDVFKAYYAFEFFGRLYRAKHQIETDDHQSIVAAADEEGVYALIANPGDEDEVCKIVVKNTTATVMKTEIVSDTETCAERYEKLSGGEAVITVPKHGTVFVTVSGTVI